MGNEMIFPIGYKVNMTFMPVAPGTFIMGDEEEFNEYGWAEKPKHEVKITKRFWLSQFLVTRQQWHFVMGYKSYDYEGEINRPIENISWDEALEFCKKLNDRFGKQLPEGYEFSCQRKLSGSMPVGPDWSRSTIWMKSRGAASA